MKTSRSRVLVESGVLIALASVLSLIKVYQAPQGGSVTAASMAPLIALALRWGPKAGVLAGAAYGILQMVMKPYVVHPVQAILDYPLAFGALGLAGFLRGLPAVGAAVGIFGRLVAHVISGVVFFSEYAPAGSNVLVYSLLYNASYLVPEVLISAVLIHALFRVRRVKEIA